MFFQMICAGFDRFNPIFRVPGPPKWMALALLYLFGDDAGAIKVPE